MDESELLKAQRTLIETSFSRGREYTGLLIGAGYTGFFALWALTKASLTPFTSYAAGALIAMSLGGFIAWEVYGAWMHAKSTHRLASGVANPDSLIRAIESSAEDAARRAVFMATVHPRIFKFTVITGFGALAIMLSAFAHGLWLSLLKTIKPGEVWGLGTGTSIVLGVALGLVANWLLDFMRQWRGSAKARRLIKEELISDLRNTGFLVKELCEKWDQEGRIDYLVLRELAESRREYPNLRPHLAAFRAESLREQIRTYYRKSEAFIEELRFLDGDRTEKLKAHENLKAAISTARAKLVAMDDDSSEARNLETSIGKAEADEVQMHKQVSGTTGAIGLVLKDLSGQVERGQIIAMTLDA